MRTTPLQFIFLLSLFSIVCCTPTTTTSSFDEKEKMLIGNWKEPLDTGQVQGNYIELHDDRTGLYGPVINHNGKVGILPYMSFLIKDWRLQNDTLSIQVAMRPGYKVVGADGKEMKGNGKPSYVRYIVREASDSVLVLEYLVSEFPGMKDRMKRTERIELLSE